MEKTKKPLKLKTIVLITTLFTLAITAVFIILKLIDYNVAEFDIADFGASEFGVEPLIPIPLMRSEFLKPLRNDDLENFEVEYHRDSFRKDIPGRISGEFTTITVLTPEDAVRSLTSVRDVMNIGSFSYLCNNVEIDRNGGSTYRLQQVYKGIPVHNGRFGIVVNSEGVALEVSGGYVGINNLNTTPKISQEKARESFQLEENERIYRTELVVYRTRENEIRLCWYFTITPKSITGINLYYRFVNAHTGELVGYIHGALF